MISGWVDFRRLGRRSDPQLPGEKRAATPLHEARHTCASVLIAAGMNAKAITHYLGHSSIDVTFDRYGHLMPGPRELYVDGRCRKECAGGTGPPLRVVPPGKPA